MSENINGIMLQGFHWYLNKNDAHLNNKSLWEFIKEQADHFREIGIDAVWIPPAYKAGSASSVGYDVYDHFDLGEFNQKGSVRTKHGTKEELHEAVNALHGYRLENDELIKDEDKKYIHVYADIVINHKDSGELEEHTWQAVRVRKDNRNEERWHGYEGGLVEIKGYTRFIPLNDQKRKQYSSFEWHVQHFDGLEAPEEIFQNGNSWPAKYEGGKYVYRLLHNEAGYAPPDKSWDEWVSLEKGNYDYLMCCDLDFERYEVREEIKRWGEWITKEMGFDGFRIDAVKHINADYIKEWLGHVRWNVGKPLFTVGEHYTMVDTGPLHNFIARVSTQEPNPQDICLFDYPLRTKFRNASWEGQSFDLRLLNQNTLMAEHPAKAVTFVENHDKQYGRELDSHVRNWFKPLAYAYILLRAHGYPCIFFPDYYGSLDNGVHVGQPDGKEYLQLLFKLRKQFALGEERYYDDKNISGWVRMGNIPEAKGAMAVVINNSMSVKAIEMFTERINKRFYHLATIKFDGTTFLTVKYRYEMYGDKAEGLYTDSDGSAFFPADGGTVAVWIEDGAGIE